MSRETILSRLPRAAPLAGPPASPPARAGADIDPAAFAATFLAAWQSLGGACEYHTSMPAARLALLLRLRSLGHSEVLTWAPAELPVPGLQEAASDAGFTLAPAGPDNPRLDFAVGLVGVDAALAATGSLVLVPHPQRSWLPALLPVNLIALVLTSQLHANLDAWRQTWLADGRAGAVAGALIITGPSVTTDLELQPIRGVFGAGQVHLILIQD